MSDELSVPRPQIQSDLAADDFLEKRENPVEFTLGQVLKNDGSQLLIHEVNKANYLVLQENQAGAVTIWDKKNESWKPMGDVPEEDRETFLLEYVPEIPMAPWKGRLILLGKQGKYSDTDPATGYPSYFIKCYFEHQVSDSIVHTGESARSTAVRLPSLGADIKVGLKTPPPEEMPDLERDLVAGLEFEDNKAPEWVTYFIENSSGNLAASVKLEENGAATIENINAQIAINSDGDIDLSTKAVGAHVRLEHNGKVTVENGNAEINIHANGNIVLSPSSGGQVIIDGNAKITGNLDVETIWYRYAYWKGTT